MMILKKTLTAIWLKILLFVLGFVFAIGLFRHLSQTVKVSSDIFFGENMFHMISKEIAGVGLIAVLLLLIVSVWESKQLRRKDPLRQLDLGLIIIFIIYAGVVAYNTIKLHGYYPGTTVDVFFGIAYLVGLGGFLELLSRIRDHDFRFYWPEFLKRYSWRTQIGAVVRLILVINLAYFVLVAFSSWFIRLPNILSSGKMMMWMVTHLILFFNSYSTHISFSLLFPGLTLVGLTIFARFSLQLGEDVAAANEEKIRAERFKAELITNVSHDMKTPLTSIINYIDLLKKLPVENQEFTEYTDVLERKSQRLKILIADLLEASKASTGAIEMNLQPLDLKEFLGQMAGEFVEDFAAKNLELIYRPSVSDIKVIADSEHLQRVMENLLGNAVKYSLTGTRVFLELSSDEGQATVSLANISKIPIEPTNTDLTEQFIRGDKARQSEGNGLGLYIAKNLTELMGGKLSIEITGDCFGVDLFIPLAVDTKENSEK